MTKPKSTIADNKPSLIQTGLAGLVKKQKIADVKRLLEIHYGPTWKKNTVLDYYKKPF